MKRALVMISLVLAFGCKSSQGTSGSKAVLDADGNLIGPNSVKELMNAPFRDWFATGYENYKPDAAVVSKLRDLSNGISIKIFMGTWCGDSKEQVPKFYKILNEAGFEDEQVSIVFVDKNKTTPDKSEAEYGITNVPTFIFYKTATPGGRRKPEKKPEVKTKELNRIVESPRETLEKDMLKILTNQPYKHTYAQ